MYAPEFFRRFLLVFRIWLDDCIQRQRRFCLPDLDRLRWYVERKNSVRRFEVIVLINVGGDRRRAVTEIFAYGFE